MGPQLTGTSFGTTNQATLNPNGVNLYNKPVLGLGTGSSTTGGGTTSSTVAPGGGILSTIGGAIGNAWNSNPLTAGFGTASYNPNAMGNFVSPTVANAATVPASTGGAPQSSGITDPTKYYGGDGTPTFDSNGAPLVGGTPITGTGPGGTPPSGNAPDFTPGATGPNAPFTLSGTDATSASLAGAPSYSDVLTKLSQMQNSYMQAYQQQIAAQAADYTQQGTDLTNVNNALYHPGGTIDSGEAAAGMARNANAFQDIQSKGNLMLAQGNVTQMGQALGFMNDSITKQLAMVPGLVNVQQTADGSIVGFIQNKLTGQVTPTNFGNPAMGTFTGGNPGGSNGMITGGNSTQSGYAPQSVSQQTYSNAIQAGVNPSIAGAAVQTPYSGDMFIDGSNLNAQQTTIAVNQQGKNGIPLLTSAQADGVRKGDQAIGALGQMSTMADQLLGSGFFGRLAGMTTNQVQAFLQTSPEWAKFNQVRTQAISYLKSMAQGGGFRTTGTEIDNAANSLVDISDNKESAQVKISSALKNIDTALNEVLPNHKATDLSSVIAKQQAYQSTVPQPNSQSSGPVTWDNLMN